MADSGHWYAYFVVKKYIIGFTANYRSFNNYILVIVPKTVTQTLGEISFDGN